MAVRPMLEAAFGGQTGGGMKRYPVGSYEETRQFLFKQFSRLTPDQKLDWLSGMTAFVHGVSPARRRKRPAWPIARLTARRRRRR